MEGQGSINAAREESHGGRAGGGEKTLLWYLCIPCRACLAFRRSKILTVEPIIFLFMFASFFKVQLYAQYYYVSYGTVLLQNTSFPFPNGSFCLNSSEVDEYAGNGSYKAVETWSDNLVFYGEVASHVPAIIITILLGPLSDRFGRKPVLFLAGLGSAIEGILAILILHFKLSPFYFIGAYFIGGLFGSFTGVLAASFSYISDISSDKWRGFRIGVLEACFSLGIGFGQFSIGFWLQWNNCDFIQPMWLFIACNVAATFYAAVCIPESLSKQERMENAEKTAKGFKSIVRGLKVFTPGVEPRYSTWKLWAATLVAGIMVFNAAGTTFIAVYFLKAPPFDLGALMIGIYQTVQDVSKALSNTLLMAIFSALKIPEAAIAIFAVLFSSGCNLLTGFSNQLWHLLTSECIHVSVCLIIPANNSVVATCFVLLCTYYTCSCLFPRGGVNLLDSVENADVEASRSTGHWSVMSLLSYNIMSLHVASLL